MNAILRLPKVKAKTGLSRSTIYLGVADESFPAPISLGARAVGWLETEIDEWIDRKIEQRRARNTAGEIAGGTPKPSTAAPLLPTETTNKNSQQIGKSGHRHEGSGPQFRRKT
jgi:prophage regulatory protein